MRGFELPVSRANPAPESPSVRSSSIQPHVLLSNTHIDIINIHKCINCDFPVMSTRVKPNICKYSLIVGLLLFIRSQLVIIQLYKRLQIFRRTVIFLPRLFVSQQKSFFPIITRHAFSGMFCCANVSVRDTERMRPIGYMNFITW